MTTVTYTAWQNRYTIRHILTVEDGPRPSVSSHTYGDRPLLAWSPIPRPEDPALWALWLHDSIERWIDAAIVEGCGPIINSEGERF